ncbi:hypothetical protein F5884DRAFT_140898 [Xylogone sp. PMI_703]|nr:hypothetical protein F5884DRAFT_140898 [Xylogone sp. PMI_703]
MKKTCAEWKAEHSNDFCDGGVIGRGHATFMIDKILENIHGDWNICNSTRKSELRAKFHNQKRHGKRWSIVLTALGHSILFLSSPDLVRILGNTLFTLEMLKAISHTIKTYQNDVMMVLRLLNPVAESLYHNSQDCLDIKYILAELGCQGVV